MRKTVAFVPIKLNNERLPNKNTLLLGNKPLCKYVLETLLQIQRIDQVYVFCSDEIIVKYIPEGVRYLKRSTYLDGAVQAQELTTAFVNEVIAELYIQVHCTAPFILAKSIDDAISHVSNQDYDSAFSATSFQDFLWQSERPLNYQLNQIPRTQDLPIIHKESTGFYVFKRDVALSGRRIGDKPYIKTISQIEAVDIDYKEDFEIAECLLPLYRRDASPSCESRSSPGTTRTIG